MVAVCVNTLTVIHACTLPQQRLHQCQGWVPAVQLDICRSTRHQGASGKMMSLAGAEDGKNATS